MSEAEANWGFGYLILNFGYWGLLDGWISHAAADCDAFCEAYEATRFLMGVAPELHEY